MHFTTLLTLLVSQASALHVFIGGNGDPACFQVDLGKDALLSEKHSAWELEEPTQKWVRDENLVIEITVDEHFDNNHRVFHQKALPFGDFGFIALDGGVHKICYRALTDGWWTKNKVKLDIDFLVGVGEAVVDTQSERKLGYFADRVSELIRKFVHINREQRLMREREASFRDVSERTNSRVAHMTVIQLIVLGATCAWQVSHLKNFFVKQKLV